MRKLPKFKLDRATKIFIAHGAKEVYLFGSQAHGHNRAASDVDFAVVGLPPRSFFMAMGEVIEAIGRPVDLVDLDQDTPFTRYLRSNGDLVRVA